MKFGKPELIDGLKFRTSECGRFDLVEPRGKQREGWWMRPGERYVLREEKWITCGRYRTMQEVQAAVAEHVRQRELVWHYFVEMVQYDKETAQQRITDPTWQSHLCTLMVKHTHEVLETPLEELILKRYRYVKYRALACTPTGNHIDPAACRDWKAMLDGTYVHWWEREEGRLRA